MEPWNFRARTTLCSTLIQANTYSSKKIFLIKKTFYILGVILFKKFTSTHQLLNLLLE